MQFTDRLTLQCTFIPWPIPV